jgi:hypothetical protein
MAKQSTNISDRLFFTVNYFDGSARIGTLASPQKDLVKLTNEELINMINFLVRHKVLEDIVPDTSEDE